MIAKKIVELIATSSNSEFIELLGCLDFNISSREEIARIVRNRLQDMGFDMYSSKLGDNLKRLSIISNYFLPVVSQAVYVLWVIGDYSGAEVLANACIKKHGYIDTTLARNLIFLYMTSGNYEKASRIAVLSNNYKQWVGIIEMIRNGNLARVSIDGYNYNASFYLTCFSTQSMEAALTHGSGRFCEEEELLAVAKYANRRRILEIGTLVGNHSVFFSKFCQCTFLKCVDLNPKSCLTTKLNLMLNNVHQDTFSIVNAKAGSPDLNLSPDKDSPKVFSLDDRINEKYDFIKIDIDGGESSFFDSSYKYIAHHKPVIFSEIQAPNFDRIFNAIINIGYKHETLSSRNHGELNILFTPLISGNSF